MRISDWSSDVCSSDLIGVDADGIFGRERQAITLHRADDERIGIAAELGVVEREGDRGHKTGARPHRSSDLHAVDGRAAAADVDAETVDVRGELDAGPGDTIDSLVKTARAVGNREIGGSG